MLATQLDDQKRAVAARGNHLETDPAGRSRIPRGKLLTLEVAEFSFNSETFLGKITARPCLRGSKSANRRCWSTLDMESFFNEESQLPMSVIESRSHLEQASAWVDFCGTARASWRQR